MYSVLRRLEKPTKAEVDPLLVTNPPSPPNASARKSQDLPQVRLVAQTAHEEALLYTECSMSSCVSDVELRAEGVQPSLQSLLHMRAPYIKVHRNGWRKRVGFLMPTAAAVASGVLISANNGSHNRKLDPVIKFY